MDHDFSAAAARKVVGVSQRCLDYWDERGVVRPSIKRAHGKGSERCYSYHDLLKLTVVKKLRENGLSLQKVRKGLIALKALDPTTDPLWERTLITDGKSLHRLTDDPRAVEDVLAGGQLVFSLVAVGEIDRNLRQRVIRLEKARSWRRRGRAVSSKKSRSG